METAFAAVAIYLFLIALKYPQETGEAVIMAFLCTGVILYMEIWARVKRGLRAIFSLGIILGATTLVICEFCIGFGTGESIPKELSGVDYILVLGNKLESDELSDTLKARLDKAVELSRQIDIPFIVSGGSSEENGMSEAEVMRAYLIGRGVENNILLETRALDTRHNFLYTAELVGRESNIVVITSEIHMFRAKMLAADAGFQNVYGICANTDKKLYLYYNLREAISIVREAVISIVDQVG